MSKSKLEVGMLKIEKVHAVVAQSTFRSQNVESTQPRNIFGSSDVEKVHGAKHISKSEC